MDNNIFNSIYIDFIKPFLEQNIVIYLIINIVIYLIGGVDDPICTLFLVHIVYIIVSLLTYNTVNLKHIFKIYLMIILGNLVDLVLNSKTASLRNYLLMFYTYNSFIDIIDILGADNKLKIPKGLKDALKKMKRD